MSSRPSKLPAWGGGSGARLANQAAAAKLRTAKDKAEQRARSASSAGFHADDKASSSSASGWGFSASAEPAQSEACPAITPSTTPVKTNDGRPPAAKALDDDAYDAGSSAASPTSAAAMPVDITPFTSAAQLGAGRGGSASLSSEARSALELLACKLGAAARGSSGTAAAQLASSSWEEAFLAGLAVGMQMPAATRRRAALQRTVLAVIVVSVLVVLGGSALLLGAFAKPHPAVYYT